MTAGQIRDITGDGALLSSLQEAQWLPGDRGDDGDWFSEGPKDKGLSVCIPGRKGRKTTVRYDKRRDK